jgi:hypothetical protein
MALCRALVATTLVPLGGTANAAEEALSETEAVAVAERFVRINGFVHRQDADPANLAFESCCSDGPGRLDEMLARREGTLLPRACGVGRAARGDRPGWKVIFCTDPRNARYQEVVPDLLERVTKAGRLVSMDPWGKDLRIQHQDVMLRFPGVRSLDGLEVLERLVREQRLSILVRRAAPAAGVALAAASIVVLALLRRRRTLRRLR